MKKELKYNVGDIVVTNNDWWSERIWSTEYECYVKTSPIRNCVFRRGNLAEIVAVNHYDSKENVEIPYIVKLLTGDNESKFVMLFHENIIKLNSEKSINTSKNSNSILITCL